MRRPLAAQLGVAARESDSAALTARIANSAKRMNRMVSDLLDFTRRLSKLRSDHPVFHRRRYFQGQPIRGTVDLGWCKPDGTEMTDDCGASSTASL